MVVIAQRTGGLANRTLLFSHVIAAGCEHGFSVVNPAFERFAPYFPSTARNLVPRFPAGRPLTGAPVVVRTALHRSVRAGVGVAWRLHNRGRDVGLIHLTPQEQLDLNSDLFLGTARRHRVLFIQGWFFRNQENVLRHADVLRSYFTPHQRVLGTARSIVEPLRRRGRLVIGVHIRHGDYRRFKGGRFFFSHDVYRQAMEAAVSAHPGRDVAFVVSSDEPPPPETFAGLEVVAAPGAELEDLYTLAACDRLIGPRSTFNRWASFWGRVPLWQMDEAGQELAPEMFRVVEDLRWDPIGRY